MIPEWRREGNPTYLTEENQGKMGLQCCPEITELTGKRQERKTLAETEGVLSGTSLMEELHAGGCGGD